MISRIRLTCLLPFLALPLLAEGMTREEADAAIKERFSMLQEQPTREGLEKKVPPSLRKLLAEAKAKAEAQEDKNNGPVRLAIQAHKLPLGDMSMPYTLVRKTSPAEKDAEDAGIKPKKTGEALFLAMHGGGQNAKAKGPHSWAVNTREFQTQTRLALQAYKPAGIYFVPRMADDRLGRWWHKHNQIAFDAVIDHAILHWNVDPDRVYLLGISEGGYGTDILAPWMADRFAGADAMAAGVGLGTPPANLRNLAFRTDVGENDMMFDRRPMAERFHAELDRLHSLDPGGYVHMLSLKKNKGHGINYQSGVSWIARHTRTPWPDRVVWINQALHHQRRDRFYWVRMPEAPEKGDFRLVAAADRKTNTITVQAHALTGGNKDGNRTHGKDNVAESPRTALYGAPVEILLSDTLLDLDKAVRIVCNGKTVHQGVVERSRTVIEQALAQRPDPVACPTAKVLVKTPMAPETGSGG